ncbi:MAG: hypothetical protein IJN56_04595 [Clostridia bacterium]|nr:hypothetical protein [Clostridia bacterium]
MKNSSKILSVLLALVMVVGMLPMTALTAFAEELETIDSVSLSGLSMPVVGEHILSVSGSSLSESQYGKYEYAVLDNQTADWRDEEGRPIEYGLQVFEAGRTYSISFSVEPKDGYAFTDSNIPVYMSNLYDHQYTGSITLSQESENVTVTYTFELAGQRTYADISEFRFYNVTAPSDGDQAHYNNGVWAYNNSEMTDQYWADSEGNRLNHSTVLKGGYSYSYNYEFTAFDGYQFADNVSIRNDTIKVDWEYSFNADNTKIYITIPYYIESSAVIDSVTVEDMFLPTQGGSTRDFDSNLYQHAPSGANYTVPNQTNGWYETAAEYSSETQYEVSEESFIVGKQYKTFLVLHANDNYKFASPENVSFAFSGISESNYSYVITDGGSESNIIVAITFTAQFPAGMGTINNPVVCNNYEELKYALEHPTVQGILVNNFANDPYQTFYTLQKDKDFKKGHCAITIPTNSTKYLTINVDINIRVPYIDYLLYSFIDNRGSLTVGGTGSLNVSMNARGYPSTIIYNNGELNIGGSVTFDPTNHSFDSVHGYSVINASGSTVINSGTFIGYATNAVSYQQGSLDIYGGTFKIKNGDDQAFGLNTDTYLTTKEHNVNLYGGTFDGIRADQTIGEDVVKLPDLLGYGAYYTYYSDGSKFDPNGIKDTHETLTVKMNNIVRDIELTIDQPKQNGTPDQTVICGDYAYKQATGNDDMWDDVDVYWEESTDGQAWTKMASNDTFTVGYHYRAAVNVMTRNGNIFDIDAQIEPNVVATINGYYAEVFRYPEEDPSNLICVRFDFGILNDNIIEQIDIDGVTEPVVGEHPNYNCAISGTGYTINTAYSNGTYVINGICWKDTTDDKWLYPKDTFEIGHKYKVYIDVKTTDGYEFYTTGGSYKPEGWGYINGNYATLGVQSWANTEQSLSWEFTCQPKTFKSVGITGLDIPTDGFTPDFDAVTDSEYYTVESIEWMDCENGANEMTAFDTFIAGNEYWALITIVPKEVDGNKLCKFLASNKTIATLNGIKVEKIKNDSWQDVTSSVKAVRIYYTFKALSEESYSISGTVTSGGNESEAITVQLIPEGMTDTVYETIVTGNDASYYFAGVAPGTYDIKVTKADHDEFVGTVTVTNENVMYNVTLKYNDPNSSIKYGDVNGDGKINGKDYALVLQSINGWDVSIDKTAADVNGDSKVNGKDYALILQYINGWDVTFGPKS